MDEDSGSLKVTNRFFVLYFGFLLYIISKNFIFYYFNRDEKLVMIIGTALVISVLLISMALIVISHLFTTQGTLKRLIHLFIYIITGLMITFTESSHIKYLESNQLSETSLSHLPMSIYLILGSKPFITSRNLYYISTSITLSLFSILSILSSSSKLEKIFSSILLFALVYYKSSDLKSNSLYYKIMITEQDNPYIKSELTTPLDEILSNTRSCIKKLLKISKLASPKLFKTYENMRKKLEFITKNLQSSNIYSPRLDLMTRNMDLENRLFIEQEFFDSHASSMFNSEHISPQKMPEYSLAELQGVLSHIGSEWNFDTFFVSDCTSETLVVIGEYSIKLYQLDQILKIDQAVLKKFLKNLQDNYLDNPYHNLTHAADVLCSFLFLVNSSNIKKTMNSLEWFGGILACLAHDLRHPARNNRYLVMTQHEYAVTYNDISVLEMMHASTLFKLAQEKGLEIFGKFPSDKFQMARKLIIELILATDMAKHFEIIAYSKTKYADLVDFTVSEHRLDTFKLIIKAADVGHAAKSFDLHEKWCKLVIEEFYSQGDLEKKQGLPVSMFCDRDNTNINKSQAGFIKNIVLILFETLNNTLKSDEIELKCILQLKNNQRFWESSSIRVKSERERDEIPEVVKIKRREMSI